MAVVIVLFGLSSKNSIYIKLNLQIRFIKVTTLIFAIFGQKNITSIYFQDKKWKTDCKLLLFRMNIL